MVSVGRFGRFESSSGRPGVQTPRVSPPTPSPDARPTLCHHRRRNGFRRVVGSRWFHSGAGRHRHRRPSRIRGSVLHPLGRCSPLSHGA